MAYVIAEGCVDVMDRACMVVCPVACIQFEEGHDRQVYIDPNECIDCGACEPACPQNAIFHEYELPVKWGVYQEINAQWFTKKEAARSQVDAVKPRKKNTS